MSADPPRATGVWFSTVAMGQAYARQANVVETYRSIPSLRAVSHVQREPHVGKPRPARGGMNIGLVIPSRLPRIRMASSDSRLQEGDEINETQQLPVDFDERGDGIGRRRSGMCGASRTTARTTARSTARGRAAARRSGTSTHRRAGTTTRCRARTTAACGSGSAASG